MPDSSSCSIRFAGKRKRFINDVRLTGKQLLDMSASYFSVPQYDMVLFDTRNKCLMVFEENAPIFHHTRAESTFGAIELELKRSPVPKTITLAISASGGQSRGELIHP